MKAKTADRTPEIHEQYKKSHNSYGISEKINRNYDGFDSEKIYGESTGIVFIKKHVSPKMEFVFPMVVVSILPLAGRNGKTHPTLLVGSMTSKTIKEHDKLGKRIKEALTIDEREIESEKVSKFNGRTKPKLGQVHDPIIDSFNAKPGQAFGYIELPDNFDAKYLVHDRSGEVFKESKQYTEGVTARVRHKLNRSGWNRFDTLKQNFAFFDGGRKLKSTLDLRLKSLKFTNMSF